MKELNNWETNFEEVEKELETFYREAMPDISIMDTDSEPTLGTHSSNTSGKAFQESSTKTPPAKVKMKKLHTLYANKKRKLEDSERYVLVLFRGNPCLSSPKHGALYSPYIKNARITIICIPFIYNGK